MTKKRAKVNFIIVAILLIVGFALAFVKMPLAFSSDSYASLFGAITKTQDLSDGIVAVYDITSDINETDINNSIDVLSSILDRQGFKESRIVRQGDLIRIETQNIEGAKSLLDLIGTPVTIEIDNKKGEEKSEYALTEKDIIDASLYTTTQDYTKTVYGITINFTQAGQKKFYDLTNEAYTADSSNAKIYMSINGEEQGSGISISQAMDTNVISYSLYQTEDSSKLSTYEAYAKQYVVQFQVATADIKIETKEIATMSSLNQDAYIYAMIVFAVAIVLSFALFIVKYKDLGILTSLSSMFFIIFCLFFIQAIPGVYVSISGIYAMVLSFCLIQGLHLIMQKEIKKEFKHVKRIPLAFKNGYRKSVFKILDICVIAFVSAIIMVFAGGTGLKSFGMIMSIGSAVALFSTVVVTKGFLDWYTAINSTKPKRLNFNKEDKANA